MRRLNKHLVPKRRPELPSHRHDGESVVTVTTRAKAAVIAGAIVWLLGYGALAVFERRTRVQDLPGLNDYYAVAWGDAVLLPLLFGALTYSYLSLRSLAGRVRRVTLVAAGTVGATSGIALQALWLLDRSPRLNWTLPEPHTFNAAGWYHAAFLTAMTAAFTSLTVALLIQLRALSRENPANSTLIFQSPMITLISACTIGFLLLNVRDALTGTTTNAQLATWAAFSVSMVALVTGTVWAVGRRVVVMTPLILSGSFVAVSLYILTYAQLTARSIIVLVVSLGASLALTSSTLWPQWGLRPLASIGVTLTLTAPIHLSLNAASLSLTVALISVVGGGVLAAIFMNFGLGSPPKVVDLVFLPIMLLAIAVWGLWLPQNPETFDTTAGRVGLAAATLAPGFVIKQLGEHRYQELITAESDQNTVQQVLRQVLIRVWLWVSGVFLAAFVALLTLSVGAASSAGFL